MAIPSSFIHASAIVETTSVGKGTRIWQFCVIQRDVVIGSMCNICFSVFIENGVTIGNNVTIKNHVSIWRGIEVESDVFIGAGTIFTNDKHPKAGLRDKPLLKTVIERGASLGAGCVVLPGLRLGLNCQIGAGSIVTRDVSPGEVYIFPRQCQVVVPENPPSP